MDDLDLRSMAEAALDLRTSRETLRYWRQIGKGPASFVLGRHVVYRRADLVAWVRDQELETGRGAPEARSSDESRTQLPSPRRKAAVTAVAQLQRSGQ